MTPALAALGLLLSLQDPAPQDPWQASAANAEQARRAVNFCLRYAEGWLGHADPRSGLLPRRLKQDAFWNARDCAADNWPFLMLTGVMSGQHHLRRAGEHILAQERRLTSRVGVLPDDFLFATQSFRPGEPDRDGLIFGAAEYCKDGLMPVIEWAGHGSWSRRLLELLAVVAAEERAPSPAGALPSANVEVNGDLLQAGSRAFWFTGDPVLRDLVFRIGDHYLLHRPLIEEQRLSLRDHGCEIIGGLSEAYVVAGREDPERGARWRGPLHALLDTVLAHGVRPDGLLHNAIDPRDGSPVGTGASDGWGYVLDAVLTVAQVDGVERYRDAAAECVRRVVAVDCGKTPGLGGADGCADTVEGALNLLQRLPEEATLAWVDREIEHLFRAQRSDGILEAWYGDGNSARTMWMWALRKTQGITAEPWRADLALGAAATGDGGLRAVLRADFDWRGRLRFDRPRHRDWLRMPADHPRINQWPEWFAIDRHDVFLLRTELEGAAAEERTVAGSELWNLSLSVPAGKTLRLSLTPRPDARAVLRRKALPEGDAPAITAWQRQLRSELTALLRIDDLLVGRVPLEVRTVSESAGDGYQAREVELQATAGRRFRATLTLPTAGAGPFPAVVCIHGHGGTRAAVHDARSIYRGFARELAASGFVTIACDVGQHDVREPDRTLMGERLWDLIRCVDHLAQLRQVDRARIGCAGLSLGGEMAMWLGALDDRVAATVSSGFLTTMDQLEQGHCMCWKFPGLRELVDFADVYALAAPRALQCQNGIAEPPTDFCVPLARGALAQMTAAWAAHGATDRLRLHVHREGHVVDLAATVGFLRQHLLR